LRQWKANIICLKETKLEIISKNIVRNLWGCPFVDLCYLASGGMLIMWDKRIVEKIDVPLEVLLMTFLGPLPGSTVLTSTPSKVLFGMSWLDFLFGGSCLGVLGATSMSLAFIPKD